LLDSEVKLCYTYVIMKRKSNNYCTICDERSNEESYPFCSNCGAFLIELEDLDLSEAAPLDVIYKKTKDTFGLN
jgi:hypothetical protein